MIAEFGDGQPFLEEVTWSPVACRRLLKILIDHHSVIANSSEVLQIELLVAAFIDTGLPFVSATYTLESEVHLESN